MNLGQYGRQSSHRDEEIRYHQIGFLHHGSTKKIPFHLGDNQADFALKYHHQTCPHQILDAHLLGKVSTNKGLSRG